jgi:hypothetical protein
MTAVGLLLLSPIRFEYMTSILGLGYSDALARIAMGEAMCLSVRFAVQHVRRLLSQNPPHSASSRADPRGKLKAA